MLLDPLPPINKVLSMFIQHERQLNISITSGTNASLEHAAYVAAGTYNNNIYYGRRKPLRFKGNKPSP